MIRRSGNKIYTKVTQYFTDDNSAVGYSHSLTSPTESFCGTDFYYEQRLTSSLANGKWRDCLYGPFTFCSGSTSSSACESGNCNQFYLDTATINIDPTGVMLDETSNVTLYTGSRMYLSSSLELAPDAYYASGSNWYKVGNGNAGGYNAGTIITNGSCTVTPPPTGSTYYTIDVKLYGRVGSGGNLTVLQSADNITFTPSVQLNSSEGGELASQSFNGTPGYYYKILVAKTTGAVVPRMNAYVLVGTTDFSPGPLNGNVYCSGLNDSTLETNVFQLPDPLQVRNSILFYGDLSDACY
jgi:hypothetical protein